MKTLILIFVLFVISTCLFSTVINVPADQPTIQEGIVAAVDTDTVLVADGTYFENIDFLGKAITVASNFLINADTLHIANTIINGSQPANPDYGSVVTFMSNEDTTSVITGFTLTEGSGTIYSGIGLCGGGIICDNSSPKMVSNIVTNNSTDYSSGVGIVNNSSPILLSNVISYNTAAFNSGGLTVIWASATSHTTVENCHIFGNTCGGSGGGLFVSNADIDAEVDVINCTINDNHADSYGGGVLVYNCANVNLSYTSIFGNSASIDGGGVEIQNSIPIITNCTIYGNEAPGCGSQIDCWSGGLEAINSFVGGNSINGSVYFNVSTPTFDYCDFYNDDGPDFDGPLVPTTLGVITTVNYNEDPCDEFMNIFLDPLFVDPANDDFHLTEFSPCIDAGDSDYPLDPDGTYIEIGRYYLEQTGIEDNTIVQTKDFLQQNYPNPFNPETTISFTVTQTSSFVSLEIYNLKGQKVRTLVDEMLESGNHSVIWNGKDDNNKSVSSGIYFYKLKTDNYEETKKMILMK